MSKGNRKRSNVSKTKKAVKIDTLPNKVTDTAIKNVAAQFDVPILNDTHVQMMKESVSLAANVQKLIKQQQMKETQVHQGKKLIQELKEGKVKAPLMHKRGENLFVPIYDINMLIKAVDEENSAIKQSIDITEGQLSHWYDEYVSSLIRQYNMLKSILKDKAEVTSISNHTRGAGEAKKAEEEAFIKKFDLENASDADLQEVKKAVKEAREVNSNASSTRKQGKENS